MPEDASIEVLFDQKLAEMEQRLREFTREVVQQNPYARLQHYDLMNVLMDDFLARHGLVECRLSVRTDYPILMDGEELVRSIRPEKIAWWGQ